MPNDVRNEQLDALIYGYLQRNGYVKTMESLAEESSILTSLRQMASSQPILVPVNDRFRDKTLEQIFETFSSSSRSELPEALIELISRLNNVSNDFSYYAIAGPDRYQRNFLQPSSFYKGRENLQSANLNSLIENFSQPSMMNQESSIFSLPSSNLTHRNTLLSTLSTAMHSAKIQSDDQSYTSQDTKLSKVDEIIESEVNNNVHDEEMLNIEENKEKTESKDIIDAYMDHNAIFAAESADFNKSLAVRKVDSERMAQFNPEVLRLLCQSPEPPLSPLPPLKACAHHLGSLVFSESETESGGLASEPSSSVECDGNEQLKTVKVEPDESPVSLQQPPHNKSNDYASVTSVKRVTFEPSAQSQTGFTKEEDAVVESKVVLSNEVIQSQTMRQDKGAGSTKRDDGKAVIRRSTSKKIDEHQLKNEEAKRDTLKQRSHASSQSRNTRGNGSDEKSRDQRKDRNEDRETRQSSSKSVHVRDSEHDERRKQFLNEDAIMKKMLLQERQKEKAITDRNTRLDDLVEVKRGSESRSKQESKRDLSVFKPPVTPNRIRESFDASWKDDRYDDRKQARKRFSTEGHASSRTWEETIDRSKSIRRHEQSNDRSRQSQASRSGYDSRNGQEKSTVIQREKWEHRNPEHKSRVDSSSSQGAKIVQEFVRYDGGEGGPDYKGSWASQKAVKREREEVHNDNDNETPKDPRLGVLPTKRARGNPRSDGDISNQLDMVKATFLNSIVPTPSSKIQIKLPRLDRRQN